MPRDAFLSALEQRIRAIENNDEYVHHQILSYLSESIDDTNAGSVPPLDVVLYGINRIIYPTMLWEHTKELLSLFSLTEFYRQSLVSNCLEALRWNSLYVKDKKSEVVDGIPLSRKDVSILDRILRKAQMEVLRETYSTIVLQISAHHINYSLHFDMSLRLIPDFATYFPPPETFTNQSPVNIPIWLRGLPTSKSELRNFVALRTGVLEAIKPLQDCEDRQKGFDTYAISVRGSNIPIILEWSGIAALVCSHTAKIQALMSEFESIFTKKQARPNKGNSISLFISQTRPC